MAAKRERRCWAGRAWLVVLQLALAAPLAAQERQLQQTEAPPEAMAHFESGREHFRAGRYREAIVELRAALELDPGSPTLMYNVAYTYELLGSLKEATRYYRKYLAALPASASAEREKARATLRRLEGARAQVAATPESPPPEDSAATSSESSASQGIGRADTWFWLSLGSGVALLGGGAVTGFLALQREDDVAAFVVGDDGSIAERQDLVDEADHLALASDLLVGGGAALVTTAALLFFLRDPEAESARATAAVTINGRAALFQLRGAF